MSTGAIVAIIVVVLVVVAVLAVLAVANRRRRLRERFGPEYDRAVRPKPNWPSGSAGSAS